MNVRTDTAPTQPDQLVGRVFGDKYEIVAPLGQGGMGSVWKARHVAVGNHVALKVMRADVAGRQSDVQRFCREARISSSLSHPNTIRVFDFGTTDDGLVYMVVELLKGLDLRELQQRERTLAPLRVVRIARQVCQSLDEAHAAGLVHRDLKPSNIFLTEVHRKEDFVKVIDFGISKYVEADASAALTADGAVVGTPRYMAPEQARGRAVDRRADLYALGVVIYELLTGTIPFDDVSTPGLLVAHATKEPRPLPAAVGTEPIPAELRQIVGQLLRKEPDDRPQTAVAVEERLEAIEAALLAGPGTDPTELRSAPAAPPPATPPPAPRRAGRPLVGLAVLAGGLALAAALWLAPWPRAAVEPPQPRAAPSAGAPPGAARPAAAPAGADAAALAEHATAASADAGALAEHPAVAGPAARPDGSAGAVDGGSAAAGTVVVELRSEPSGAVVRSEDRALGRTPLPVAVGRDGLAVELSHRGHVRERVHLTVADAPARTVRLGARKPPAAAAPPAGETRPSPAIEIR